MLIQQLEQLTLPEGKLNTRSTPIAVHGTAPHAIVIGAGFGGLAAAIRLGARGYRVTVVDRLPQAGGRARVHSIEGHHFDAGPTVITAPFLFEELWRLCGRHLADDVDLRPVDPFYRIRFHDGALFDYSGDGDRMIEQIKDFSPDDVDGYQRFLAHSEEIFRVGFEKLAHVPFLKVSDMARILPSMVRLESHRSVYSLVAKYIRDERLRQVLSFHPLLVGGNPFQTTSIYTLIAFLERKWGVHFPIGGTGKLVQGMVQLIEGLGGQLSLGQEVKEILVEAGQARGIRLQDGTVLKADIIVSNADSAWTYRKLIAPEHRRHWTDKRIDRSRFSMSLFVWYFGTRRQYPEVPHHTILLGPRYRGLLDDIFKHKVLADDFSLYLHRPTATSPNLAPAGHDSFYVLSPVPHLDSGTDWRTEAERYRKQVEAYLEATLLPGLSRQLSASHMLTPQGFADDYLSWRGAAFSFEPVLQQSAYLRPHNVSEDIRGLYLVGAGTHPGAGLPGVLSSARVLDTVVPDAAELQREGVTALC
ncbi:MAG: phytoene desaturase [Polyangiales bacterium]